MNYILHRAGNGRFVLQSATTGNLIGFTIHPAPTESRQMFAYDVGTTYDPNTLVNIDQFPELAELPFFAIEYPSHYDFSTCLRSESWSHLHHLFLAEGKAIGYSGNYGQPPLPNPLETLWQNTPHNHAGLWKMPAWGLWVDHDGIWFGNRQGIVLKFNHDGEACQEWNLPKNVSNFWVREGSAYATCDDGYIYDLSGKLPEIFYQARWDKVSLWSDFWLNGLTGISANQVDRHQNETETYLHIADGYGKITQLLLGNSSASTKWECQWEYKTDLQRTWFFTTDGKQIYQGHRQGVNAYNVSSGKLVWSQSTETEVLCGLVTDDGLIIGCSDRWLYRLGKDGDLKAKTTTITPLAKCEGGVYSCTKSENGAYLFVADHETYLYGFTAAGELLWRRPTGCGAALNLRWYDERLYATTTEGTLAVFAVDAATLETLTKDYQQKNLLTQNPVVVGSTISQPLVNLPIKPKMPRKSSKSKSAAPVTPLGTASITEWVIVECILVGNKIRVRVVSEGYQSDWSVQFPTKLREVGARYRVSKLTPVPEKNFYRAGGIIERIDD